MQTGRGLGWSAGQVRVRSVRMRDGSGQDFSNPCGCGVGLNLAGEGRERTKKIHPAQDSNSGNLMQLSKGVRYCTVALFYHVKSP